jgi:DNA polymerase
MTVDARHKAMLREMGVRLWQPTTTPTPTPTPTAAPQPQGPQDPQDRNRASAKASAPATGGHTPASRPDAAASQTAEAAQGPDSALVWQVQAVKSLHSAGPSGDGPRWLLLAEQREESSGSTGDAAALLERMLRAAGLHQGSQVWLAPLQRSAQGEQLQGLEQALAVQPDLVFVMGRLAAQALLESNEPLGRLRGQVHDVWGAPAVVSYDCVTLLRSPAEKAKAWDDLCLALRVAREQYEERRASESD